MDSASSNAAVWKMFFFCFFFFVLLIFYSSVRAGEHKQDETSDPSAIMLPPPAACRYDKHAPVSSPSPPARSLAHSLIHPPSLSLLCHSLTLPCTHISLSICPPAFLGHSAPPTFIHTTPCFVFMRAGWRAAEVEEKEGGWWARAGDGWKDDFSHSTTGLEERIGGRSPSCSSILEDHTRARSTLAVSFTNFSARAQTPLLARTHTPFPVNALNAGPDQRCVVFTFHLAVAVKRAGCSVPGGRTWERPSSQWRAATHGNTSCS